MKKTAPISTRKSSINTAPERTAECATIEASPLAEGMRQSVVDRCEAIAALMLEWQPQLRRLIRSRLDTRLKRRLDEDDVLQEALLNALSRSSSARHEQPTLPWLARICINTITDLHRRHFSSEKRNLSRVQTLSAIGGWDGDQTAMRKKTLTPYETSAAAETQEQLRIVMSRLNDKDQEILFLRVDRQLTNHQTAHRLNVNEKAASIRFRRALDRLRREMVNRYGSD